MGSINTMLTLDGESQFRRALNNINAGLKTLEKELDATSTDFVTAAGKMNQSTQISAVPVVSGKRCSKVSLLCRL